jgi:hypothetical protein
MSFTEPSNYIENIASLTQLSEQEIRNILNEYSIKPGSSTYSGYANFYEGACHSDRSNGVLRTVIKYGSYKTMFLVTDKSVTRSIKKSET